NRAPIPESVSPGTTVYHVQLVGCPEAPLASADSSIGRLNVSAATTASFGRCGRTAMTATSSPRRQLHAVAERGRNSVARRRRTMARGGSCGLPPALVTAGVADDASAPVVCLDSTSVKGKGLGTFTTRWPPLQHGASGAARLAVGRL